MSCVQGIKGVTLEARFPHRSERGPIEIRDESGGAMKIIACTEDPAIPGTVNRLKSGSNHYKNQTGILSPDLSQQTAVAKRKLV